MIEKNRKTPTLYFESVTEKLEAVKAFNAMLRAAGFPAVHEGLDQKSPQFAIYLCIYETPVDPLIPLEKITVEGLEKIAVDMALREEHGQGKAQWTTTDGTKFAVRYREGNADCTFWINEEIYTREQFTARFGEVPQ